MALGRVKLLVPGYFQALGSHAPIVPTKILGDPDELDRHLVHSVPESYNMRHVQRGDTSYDNGYMYSQESDIEMHVSVTPETANGISFHVHDSAHFLFPFHAGVTSSLSKNRDMKKYLSSFRQDPVSSWTWYATQCQLERCQLYRRCHFRCSSRISRCSPWSPSTLIHCQRWSASRSISRKTLTASGSLLPDTFAKKVIET